jgi:hypothetical protein
MGQIFEVYFAEGGMKAALLLRIAAVLALVHGVLHTIGLCWAKRTVRAAHECPP